MPKWRSKIIRENDTVRFLRHNQKFDVDHRQALQKILATDAFGLHPS
jgi:hypothetical protein